MNGNPSALYTVREAKRGIGKEREREREI